MIKIKFIKKAKSFLIVMSIILPAVVFAPHSTANEGLRAAQTQVSEMWELQDDDIMGLAQSFKTVEDQIDITKVEVFLDSDESLGYCLVGISEDPTMNYSNWLDFELKPLLYLDNDWISFPTIDIEVQEQTTYFLMVLVTSSGKTAEVGVKQFSTYGNGKIWQCGDPSEDDWLPYTYYDMAFKVYGNVNSGGPNAPSTPSGPGSGYTGTSYTYSTSASDPDGDQVYYYFDWGDASNSGWVGPYDSGETGSASHNWSSPGTYFIKAKAKDEHGATSGWSPNKIVIISNPTNNNPPNTPSTPSGPVSGYTGTSYTYSTSATDPDGDDVYYKFSWGDGSNSGWVGPYESGETGNASHSWDSPGDYLVKAKAKDTENDESGWSSEITVTITYPPDNDPPGRPSTPSGPNTLEVGQTGTFSTNATDPNGDQVKYRFDWNDGEISGWTNLVPSGESASKSHSWSLPGTYFVISQAMDQYGEKSSWSKALVVEVEGNVAPDKPSTPDGPTYRDIFQAGTYITSSEDLDGDKVRYRFDWNAKGSHDYSDWTSLKPSGTTVSMNRSWSKPGTYYVKAQAKDENGEKSGWSDALIVTVNSYGNPKDYYAIMVIADFGAMGNLIAFRNTQYVYDTLTDHLNYPKRNIHGVIPFSGGKKPTKANLKEAIRDVDEVTDEDTNILVYMNVRQPDYNGVFKLDYDEDVSVHNLNSWLSELEYNTLTIVIECDMASALIPDLSGKDRILIASTKKVSHHGCLGFIWGSFYTESFFSALRSGCSYGRAWEEADKDMYEWSKTIFWLTGQSPQIDDNGDGSYHGNMDKADKLPIKGDGSIALFTHPTGPKDPGENALTITSDASVLNLFQDSSVNGQSSSTITTFENIVTKKFQNMINNLNLGTGA